MNTTDSSSPTTGGRGRSGSISQGISRAAGAFMEAPLTGFFATTGQTLATAPTLPEIKREGDESAPARRESLIRRESLARRESYAATRTPGINKTDVPREEYFNANTLSNSDGGKPRLTENVLEEIIPEVTETDSRTTNIPQDGTTSEEKRLQIEQPFVDHDEPFPPLPDEEEHLTWTQTVSKGLKTYWKFLLTIKVIISFHSYI